MVLEYVCPLVKSPSLEDHTTYCPSFSFVVSCLAAKTKQVTYDYSRCHVEA